MGTIKRETLCCLRNFQQAQSDMQWANGPELFKVIQEILEDTADVDHWDGLCSNNDSRSAAAFDTLTKDCIKCEFANNMKSLTNHKKFLILIKKPKALTVQEFVALLQCHNKAVPP